TATRRRRTCVDRGIHSSIPSSWERAPTSCRARRSRARRAASGRKFPISREFSAPDAVQRAASAYALLQHVRRGAPLIRDRQDQSCPERSRVVRSASPLRYVLRCARETGTASSLPRLCCGAFDRGGGLPEQDRALFRRADAANIRIDFLRLGIGTLDRR